MALSYLFRYHLANYNEQDIEFHDHDHDDRDRDDIDDDVDIIIPLSSQSLSPCSPSRSRSRVVSRRRQKKKKGHEILSLLKRLSSNSEEEERLLEDEEQGGILSRVSRNINNKQQPPFWKKNTKKRHTKPQEAAADPAGAATSSLCASSNLLSTFLLFWMAWLTDGIEHEDDGDDNDNDNDEYTTTADDDVSATTRPRPSGGDGDGGGVNGRNDVDNDNVTHSSLLFSPTIVELTTYILENVARYDVSLSHRMELLATSLDNSDLKRLLMNLRQYRRKHAAEKQNLRSAQQSKSQSLLMEDRNLSSSSSSPPNIAILDAFESHQGQSVPSSTLASTKSIDANTSLEQATNDVQQENDETKNNDLDESKRRRGFLGMFKSKKSKNSSSSNNNKNKKRSGGNKYKIIKRGGKTKKGKKDEQVFINAATSSSSDEVALVVEEEDQHKSVESFRTFSDTKNVVGKSSTPVTASMSLHSSLNTNCPPSLPTTTSTNNSVPTQRLLDGSTIVERSLNLTASSISQLVERDTLFENLLGFLDELETITLKVEQSLIKTFSQKFARWALQPWSANKETQLAQVTHSLREHLKKCNLRFARPTTSYGGTNDSSTKSSSEEEDPLLPMLDPMLPPSRCSSGQFDSVDPDNCFILPSAHFPLLLTFESNDVESSSRRRQQVYRTVVELIGLERRRSTNYNKTTLEQHSSKRSTFVVHGCICGSVMKSERSTGIDRQDARHVWDTGNMLVFETRSSSYNSAQGLTMNSPPPSTLSIRVIESIVDEKTGEDQLVYSDSKSGKLSYSRDCGYGWIDMSSFPLAGASSRDGVTVKTTLIAPTDESNYDEHGDLIDYHSHDESNLIDVQLRITTKSVEIPTTKKSLLYKHDDDLRQELFAIEFIKLCDRILQACGLDLKMVSFECVPVGKNRGFIEWIDGSVPLSEICHRPFSTPGDSSTPKLLVKSTSTVIKHKSTSTSTKNENGRKKDDNKKDDDDQTLSSVVRAGLSKYESLREVEAASTAINGGSMATADTSSSNRARTRSGQKRTEDGTGSSSSVAGSISPPSSTTKNPIQDFLRSFAYNKDDPYQIQRLVMERFVKSCAGYTVCTYLLGVGDRHLDNLLLHPSGHFFHCDYSFILGQDPKLVKMRSTSTGSGTTKAKSKSGSGGNSNNGSSNSTVVISIPPMRITHEMVDAMGGRDSDLYCQFLNLVSATYLTLRRPENVRALLSSLRLMYGSGLPDLEQTQSHECAVNGLLDRLQLQLNDDDAISFIESLVEESYSPTNNSLMSMSSNKMVWLAVDAIHSLGKRF